MIRRRNRLCRAMAITIALLGACPVIAAAVELSVYAPGGVRSALQVAASAFESETGNTIKFTFGTGGGIQKQVAEGAPADVTVLPSAGATGLEKKGIVASGSRLEVGSVGVGIGIKAGMPRPKIATIDEFRDTLLAVKSITYADPARGGTSGTYFASVVLPRLGLVENMRAKTVLTGVGEEAVKRVVSGESEIVVVQAVRLRLFQVLNLLVRCRKRFRMRSPMPPLY